MPSSMRCRRHSLTWQPSSEAELPPVSGRTWRICGVLALAAVLGVPTAALARDAWAAVRMNPETLRLAIPAGRSLMLLLRSCALSAATALLCLAIGTAGALFLLAAPARLRWLRMVIILPVIIPPYLHAVAWMRIGEGLRVLLRGGGLALPPFQGFWAALWVQVMVYAPLMAGVALAAWSMVDPLLVDAGLVHGSPQRVLRRILLPLMWPVLTAGTLLVFVLCMGDLSVPSLFSVNTYALELYARFSASGRTADVTLLAVPVVLLCLAALAPAMRGIATVLSTPSARDGAASSAWRATGVVRAGALCGTAVLAVDVAGLCGSLLAGAQGATWAAVHDALPQALVSLRTAGGACLVSLVLALTAGPLVAAGNRSGRWMAAFLLVPLALPGPLAGTGASLAGTLAGGLWKAAAPALLLAFRFGPFACLMTGARLARLDSAAAEAGRLFERRRGDYVRCIWLPTLGPVLVAALLLVAILGIGEVSGTLLVMQPGQQPLALAIYNYLHYGGSGTVSALCLILLAGLLALMAPALFLWNKGWRRA